MKDSYYNMKEKIEPHMDLIDKAKASMEKLGIQPIVVPDPGGTDEPDCHIWAALSEPVHRRQFPWMENMTIPVQSMER